jgi:prolyl 4-hydroxylase
MNRTSPLKRLRDQQITVFDRVLSRNECNRLLLGFDARLWMRSMVLDVGKDKKLRGDHSSFRTSNTQVLEGQAGPFEDALQHISQKIVERAEGLDPRCWEFWQVTRYHPGQRFYDHLDSHPHDNPPEGRRSKTILLYLQAPQDGGATYFRAFNLWVYPKPGRLVIWNNLLPTGNPNFAMIHSGEPVIQGIKVILQTWQRQGALNH